MPEETRQAFKDYLQAYHVQPNPSLGQNFLHEASLLNKMAEEMVPEVPAWILEWGAGTGTLTQALAPRASGLVTCEIDEQLIRPLQDRLASLPAVRLYYGDVLKADPAELLKDRDLDRPFYVVGNLPYYITTKLIEHALTQFLQANGYAFLIQKECLDRLLTLSGKAYGPLAILIAVTMQARAGRFLPRQAFCPMPAVDSQVLHLTPRSLAEPLDRQAFLRFLKQAFAQRRKTLRHAFARLQATYPLLQNQTVQTWLQSAGLFGEAPLRPEQIPPEGWLALYRGAIQQADRLSERK